jgi:hypothetical protein
MSTIFENIVGQVFLHEDGFELHEESHGSRQRDKLGSTFTQHNTKKKKSKRRYKKGRHGKARTCKYRTGHAKAMQAKDKTKTRQPLALENACARSDLCLDYRSFQDPGGVRVKVRVRVRVRVRVGVRVRV